MKPHAGTRRGPGPHGRSRLLLPTLQGYPPAWLSPDIVAGLTLLAIAVPEQMATARLAFMPAPAGLYAFVAGSLMIALFGATGQMSVGADSTIAPVVATGVATVAVAGSPHYQHVVAATALAVGVMLLVVGLLRLGWVADFISAPVVTGILAGIGLEILVRQIPAVLGLPGGGTSTVSRVGKLIHQLPQTNGWTVGIGVVVLAVIVVSEKVNRRIPGALIGLVVSVVAVAALGLRHRGVQVIGAVPVALPALGPPRVPAHVLLHLTGTALTVAFVCVVQTAATARSLGTGNTASANLDKDLTGVGAANLVTGLIGSFPVNSSPPRSTVVAASGGRSQMASLVAAAGMLLVIAVATGLLSRLPEATLAAILIFVATRMFHVKDLRAMRRFDLVEYALALITMAAVALFGIELGVLVALGLSLAQRTRIAARPPDAIMGREPGTDHWIAEGAAGPTEQIPGVLVYLLLAPLWFGNAQYVVERISSLIDSAPQPIHALVLDAAGVSDIDFTGAQALHALLVRLRSRGVAVAVARASGLVPTDLQRSTLLADIGPDHVFENVEAAVESVGAARPEAP